MVLVSPLFLFFGKLLWVFVSPNPRLVPHSLFIFLVVFFIILLVLSIKDFAVRIRLSPPDLCLGGLIETLLHHHLALANSLISDGARVSHHAFTLQAQPQYYQN